jgi:DNA-binding response OmpR family regulator
MSMKLLLVDDYLPLRKSVSKGLREAGYAVDVADDGENALWYATSGEYDVIVLDLVLPVLDGLSVLRELRLKKITTHVLIISAKDAVGDRIRGLDAGADDYLVKPFAFEELLARIRALIRRKYGQKGRAIPIEDLEIDTTSRRVWRDEEEIHLTLREYALLEYLALRQGETVSRTDIWEHLYDFADTCTSNVVDVYIGYLRKKIDLPGRPSLIRTVRGRGYALGATR